MEKACNPSRAERLANEDFACLEKYIKEFSVLYVYTHQASSKDPLTKNLRKSMTKNVKSSAHRSLLNPENRGKFGRNDGKFVDDNLLVFNFVKDDLSKNASTRIPARLFEPLASYIKSIGQISCAEIRGTCWLVGGMLVITNYHVYMLINTEREKQQNPNLPITVSFDYLRSGQTEHVVTVEVDEEQDPQLGDSRLDYKFLRLKECEGIQDRVPLGSIVQNRQLQEGLVIIVGHPKGNEMQEETCVVVSSYSWREKLKQRHDKCIEKYIHNPDPSLHMTNDRLLRSGEKYKDCVPYETSLFTGASGSPVFDLNGNIVAMHTQGYTLNTESGQCSLMEFGVHFNAIWEDMKSKERYHDVEQLFPNYNLEDMDIDD
ncbi:Hypothetical predicted protein [Paramuricea clavata]|nr:Hypothetical predicted protein [Paramuricea clavata]